MKIRVRTLERSYGEQFAVGAGLTVLNNQLIKLDRIAALRYFAYSRKVLFNFIDHFNKENGIKPKSGISDAELINILNNLIFNDSKNIHFNPPDNNKEFRSLISVIQNMTFVFLLDNIKIPNKKRKALREGLEKAHSTINAVYGPLAGKKLKKNNKNLLELFSQAFPENIIAPKLSSQKTSSDELPFAGKKVDDNKCEEHTNDIKSDKTESELTLLTRKETAALFNITLPTLSTWEKSGSIPKAIRTGERVYFRKIDLEKHLEATNNSE